MLLTIFRMKLLFILLNSIFLLVNCNNFTSVKELDLEKYTGHWNQVYASPFDFTFQGYGKCITADYKIIDTNNVSVLNSQYNKDNKYEQIKGYAYYKDFTKPGELSVILEGVNYPAPYWVIKLGEVLDNQYQYSIISVPYGPSLWVLARNINKFFRYYNNEVIEFLDEYNFNYVKINQICNF